jgi:long-chain acyl-CoA synthetase
MSDRLQALLDRASDQSWLEFLGRRWTGGAITAEAQRAASGLSGLGLAPGERLGLLLPNLPIAVAALCACWHAGLVAAPMDPRQPKAELLAWQQRVRPVALVTLDLATVYERARPLFDDPALRIVVVARMATQLSTMKRLISSWLRAGGTARPAFDARTLAWESVGGPAVQPSLPGDAPALLLPDGTQRTRNELAVAQPDGARRLLGRPLADERAVTSLLAGLAGGGSVVLSPRLDERSLLKVAKAAKTVETV